MTSVNSEYYSGLGLNTYSSNSTTAMGNSDLGQEDFLRLMITQLSNQDPTNPLKNEDFVTQMAQFSTLTGIQELTTSFESLSQTLLQGQALEAAALVGKNVLVPASKMELSAGQGAKGAVELPTSVSQVRVDIYDSKGQLVRTLDLEEVEAGIQDFEWDGKLADGSAAPADTYEFKISAQVNGTTEALTTYLNGQVKSVSAENASTGLMLDIQGIGSLSFSSVLRVG